MATIIAFSGSSNSGKTTLINTIKAKIPGCMVLNENIREFLDNTSIDEVRQNAWSYFSLQRMVIDDKIIRENRALRHKGIVLVDRSLADSLWYLTHYVTTSSLTDNQLREYTDFVQATIEAASEAGRYNHIFFAKPITSIEANHFRPIRLSLTQAMESKMIRTLNFGLFGHTTPITEVSVITETEQVLKACLQAHQETEHEHFHE